jgi:hypothetical protein
LSRSSKSWWLSCRRCRRSGRTWVGFSRPFSYSCSTVAARSLGVHTASSQGSVPRRGSKTCSS